MSKTAEADSYPRVERWLKRERKCFLTAVDKGLTYGRIDVVGVRDVGGDLSGDIETIAVEVKHQNRPFATACGQAYAYSVYANRVYLAQRRDLRFRDEEIAIASQIGVGLLHLTKVRCAEVLSSPRHEPFIRFNLGLLERLGLGKCQLCDSVFSLGNGHSFSRVTRKKMSAAQEKESGLIFWNWEVGKRKMSLNVSRRAAFYDRRYMCPDCVSYVRTYWLEK